ncbi:uncharacterized protein L969DRAFT_94811 [Mixia osmundae IAM 14324]|uniref:Uncharacterized protein n=1 Tax=Mixia osmundae (strain CBS 9802 / IAM 14324 / JCM 22182 / KY 12970) TaxID=764103 RepID=G7E4B4_MIXOS|nr:uncharacterized protein L969DRAFT_94811 [Mixia osmundae IAM 14324]KEI39771.1 hypothetical protein L969DRAFT_94811 [Mixia osmundae IAM 14324]GAA97674.1 hypothetical protein E5Q_04352 [Mixia osmundae IAM 14324]
MTTEEPRRFLKIPQFSCLPVRDVDGTARVECTSFWRVFLMTRQPTLDRRDTREVSEEVTRIATVRPDGTVELTREPALMPQGKQYRDHRPFI